MLGDIFRVSIRGRRETEDVNEYESIISFGTRREQRIVQNIQFFPCNKMQYCANIHRVKRTSSVCSNERDPFV